MILRSAPFVLYFAIALVWSTVSGRAQQIADTTYHPALPNPAYAKGSGPVVFIDEGHSNFHTKEGRYRSFASLLERDGYQVESYAGVFELSRLQKGKILVISNALNVINVENWYLPTPSAFAAEEIAVVKEWVQQGGSLFLIADHMPMAGAAQDLAAQFGFEFTNGFAFEGKTQGPSDFKRRNNTLNDCTITNGRNASERVDHIVTFTGQAFKVPADATSVLTFPNDYINLLPDTAWVFDKTTRSYKVGGWSQGAYKKFGKGKVVAFGEAAMFSAQLAGPTREKVGMNQSAAKQNHLLLLNIIHWLDGLME